jgi:proline iminopeptidase
VSARGPGSPAPREGLIPVEGARLFSRDVGQGQPILVLHGGPDFSHTYFLPELDLLSDTFRLIYYDQRGRGRSAVGVEPEDVSIDSETEDLDSVRRYLGLESVAVLGHSWGGVLAMEYAIRHPNHVSQLVLLNTAPASHQDFLLLRREGRRNAAEDLEQLRAIAATDRYQSGDLEADAEYYRIHFRPALFEAGRLEDVVGRLRIGMSPEGIRLSRAIEERLYEQTWSRSDYDLLPALRRLGVPALIVHGDHDLVPSACARHVARAIPGARYVPLRECGHFSFLERPDEVREALTALLGTGR